MRQNLIAISTEEAELEMTPMIDVTFLLLIFFMCTIKFKSLEGKLAAYLPKDGPSSLPHEAPTTPVRLYIQVQNPGRKVQASDTDRAWTGQGDFALTGRRVNFQVNRYRFENSAPGRERLRERLDSLFKADPERRIELCPGPGAVHADVVSALDLCTESGFTDITFQGR